MNATFDARDYNEHRNDGKWPSIALAALVHVALAVFLFFGVRWQSQPPAAVQVTLVPMPPSTARTVTQVPPKPAPKPVPQPEPKPVDKARVIEDNRMDELLAMDAQRAREAELLRQEAMSAARNRGLQTYIDKIRGKVRANLVRPPGLTGNPEAIFVVTQGPGGIVLDIRLKKSTGNPILDDAIKRAIQKSDPLPQPDDPSLFSRTLELTFRPLEDS